MSLPPAKVNTDVRYTAVLRTNLGNIVIGLNSRAPCTVNSFVHLAEAGFFNHTQCHRLITAGIYILQCGDPYATARMSSRVSAAAIASSSLSCWISTSGSAAYVRPKMAWVFASMKPISSRSWPGRPK